MRIIILLVLIISLSSCRVNNFAFYKKTYNPERASMQSNIEIGKEFKNSNARDFRIREVKEIRDGKEYNYYSLQRFYARSFDMNLSFPITEGEINQIHSTLIQIREDMPTSGDDYNFYKNIVTNGNDFLIIDAKLKYGKYKIRFIFSDDIKEKDQIEIISLLNEESKSIAYEKLVQLSKSRYQYEDPRILDGLIELFSLKQ